MELLQKLKKRLKELKEKRQEKVDGEKATLMESLKTPWSIEDIECYCNMLSVASMGQMNITPSERHIKMTILKSNRNLFTEEEYEDIKACIEAPKVKAKIA